MNNKIIVISIIGALLTGCASQQPYGFNNYYGNGYNNGDNNYGYNNGSGRVNKALIGGGVGAVAGGAVGAAVGAYVDHQQNEHIQNQQNGWQQPSYYNDGYNR